MSRIAQPLSKTELSQFRKAVATVHRTKNAFVECGQALAVIRDGRGYRTTHATFEEFCQDEFKMGRTYAHRLIEASGVVNDVVNNPVDNLLPVGNKPEPPSTERQARELAPVPPEQRAEVWQTAQAEAGTDQPPASKVKEVAERVVKEPAESNGKAEPEKPKRGTLKDADGTVVPDNLIDAFTRAGELSALMKKPFAAILEHLYAHHDWLYGGERDNRKLPKGRFTIGTIQPHFDSIASLVSGVTPRVVCNKCDGGGCQVCKARGWLP